MKRLYFLPFMFFSLIGTTQEMDLASDCSSAVEIAPKGNHKFTRFPKGHGETLEIAGNPSSSSRYFEREENTAWFQFEALSDDHLVFKIYPTDTAADIDFMLFKYTDEQFCEDLIQRKVRPIRSNISRYNPEELSATGLSMGAQKEFVRSGPGSHLSKALKTEKGERYYLVLNNVYGTETGFSLSFEYYTTKEISGVVKDEETGEPIGNATVTWEENHGELLAESKTDPETGEYSFNAPVQKGNRMRDYIFSVDGHKYLFNETVVTTSGNDTLEPLVTLLPKLRSGLKMTLRNINFYGGKSIPLPSSLPSFRRLLKLMRNNRSLVILIEGHTNGCDIGITRSQQLSEARANRVKRYLTEHGISEERITTQGFNCSQMLYPHPSSEKESRLNRRVEFRVVDY
jgi:outer membrane protein OmpA-like peptidoglycan-associated protein